MFFLNTSLCASKLISSQETLRLEGNSITAAKTVGGSDGDEVALWHDYLRSTSSQTIEMY